MFGPKVMAVGVSSLVHTAAALACWQLGMFSPPPPIPAALEPREISIVFVPDDVSPPAEKIVTVEKALPPTAPIPTPIPTPPPAAPEIPQVAKIPDALPRPAAPVAPMIPAPRPVLVASVARVVPSPSVTSVAVSNPHPPVSQPRQATNHVLTGIQSAAASAATWSTTGGSEATAGRARRMAPAGYRRNPAPAYPRLALRHRWEGTVLLAVNLSPDGRPLGVKVEASSGHPVLDEAAVAAVRDWEFLPTPSDQFALTSAVEVPIRFFLSNTRAN